MIRLENQYWYRDEIIRMSEACIIIHNMTISMNYSNEFEAEMEDKGCVEIYEELYAH